MRKVKITACILLLAMLIPFGHAMVSATTELEMTGTLSKSSAIDYLTTYSRKEYDSSGRESHITLEFETEEDRNAAADFIVRYGTDGFVRELEKSIAQSIAIEGSPSILAPAATSPLTVYRTVTGNGTHYVSGQASGLAHFSTLGTVEYFVTLGYSVRVIGGKISGINSPAFNISHISAGGSWGNVSLPSYSNATNAGVTANYTITKTVKVGIGGFDVIVK